MRRRSIQAPNFMRGQQCGMRGIGKCAAVPDTNLNWGLMPINASLTWKLEVRLNNGSSWHLHLNMKFNKLECTISHSRKHVSKLRVVHANGPRPKQTSTIQEHSPSQPNNEHNIVLSRRGPRPASLGRRPGHNLDRVPVVYCAARHVSRHD